MSDIIETMKYLVQKLCQDQHVLCSSDTDDINYDNVKCPKCNKRKALPPHSCPYDQELGSGKSKCICCPTCTKECQSDV